MSIIILFRIIGREFRFISMNHFLFEQIIIEWIVI